MTSKVTTHDALANALNQMAVGAAEDVLAFTEAISLDLARAQGRPELRAEVLAQARAFAEKHRLSTSRAILETVVGLAFDLLGDPPMRGGSDAQG